LLLEVAVGGDDGNGMRLFVLDNLVVVGTWVEVAYKHYLLLLLHHTVGWVASTSLVAVVVVVFVVELHNTIVAVAVAVVFVVEAGQSI